MSDVMSVRGSSLLRGGLLLLFIGLLAFAPVTATAGKPSSPPPSGKWIYYSGPAKMASDGSNRTALPGAGGQRISDVRYDESYWSVTVLGVAGTKTPEGYGRYKLSVGPVETSDAPFVILDDPLMNPFCPTFRPGSTPRVTFSAVVWDENGENPTAGLYQIAFGTDGSFGDPELLIECATFSDWLNPDYTETVPELTWQDWYDEYTLVYEDDVYQNWGNGGSWEGQLYVGDIRDDPSTHTALIADGQPLAGFGVHFNSTGTAVIYNVAYVGIYEVSTAGNSTPTRWVADTQAGPVDWLDDDTIIYNSFTYGRKYRHDIYKMKRGQGATNLTKDMTLGPMAFGVR